MPVYVREQDGVYSIQIRVDPRHKIPFYVLLVWLYLVVVFVDFVSGGSKSFIPVTLVFLALRFVLVREGTRTEVKYSHGHLSLKEMEEPIDITSGGSISFEERRMFWVAVIDKDVLNPVIQSLGSPICELPSSDKVSEGEYFALFPNSWVLARYDENTDMWWMEVGRYPEIMSIYRLSFPWKNYDLKTLHRAYFSKNSIRVLLWVGEGVVDVYSTDEMWELEEVQEYAQKIADVTGLKYYAFTRKQVQP